MSEADNAMIINIMTLSPHTLPSYTLHVLSAGPVFLRQDQCMNIQEANLITVVSTAMSKVGSNSVLVPRNHDPHDPHAMNDAL